MLRHLIRVLREQHGMSLRDVARASGYHVSQLSRSVNGERKFSVTMAQRLADTFGLSAEDRGRLLAATNEGSLDQLTPEERQSVLAVEQEEP